jgi:hypothetical protein
MIAAITARRFRHQLVQFIDLLLAQKLRQLGIGYGPQGFMLGACAGPAPATPDASHAARVTPAAPTARSWHRSTLAISILCGLPSRPSLPPSCPPACATASGTVKAKTKGKVQAKKVRRIAVIMIWPPWKNKIKFYNQLHHTIQLRSNYEPGANRIMCLISPKIHTFTHITPPIGRDTSRHHKPAAHYGKMPAIHNLTERPSP